MNPVLFFLGGIAGAVVATLTGVVALAFCKVSGDRVSLPRSEYEGLLDDLDDAEDRVALLEHRLACTTGTAPEALTIEEADEVIAGRDTG